MSKVRWMMLTIIKVLLNLRKMILKRGTFKEDIDESTERDNAWHEDVINNVVNEHDPVEIILYDKSHVIIAKRKTHQTILSEAITIALKFSTCSS